MMTILIVSALWGIGWLLVWADLARSHDDAGAAAGGSAT